MRLISLLATGVLLLSGIVLAAPIEHRSLQPTSQEPQSDSVGDGSYHHEFKDENGVSHHIKHSKSQSAPGQVTVEHTADDGREPFIGNVPEHSYMHTDQEGTQHTSHHSIQGNQLHSHHTELRQDGSMKSKHSIDGVAQEGTIKSGGVTTDWQKHYIGGQLHHETLESTMVDNQGRSHTLKGRKSNAGQERTTDHYIDDKHVKTVMTLRHGTPNEATSVFYANGHRKTGQWADNESFDW